MTVARAFADRNDTDLARVARGVEEPEARFRRSRRCETAIPVVPELSECQLAAFPVVRAQNQEVDPLFS